MFRKEQEETFGLLTNTNKNVDSDDHDDYIINDDVDEVQLVMHDDDWRSVDDDNDDDRWSLLLMMVLIIIMILMIIISEDVWITINMRIDEYDHNDTFRWKW